MTAKAVKLNNGTPARAGRVLCPHAVKNSYNPELKPGRDSGFKSRLNQSTSPQISIAAGCLCAPIIVVHFLNFFNCNIVAEYNYTTNVARAAGNGFCAAFFDMVNFVAETFPCACGLHRIGE
jgi:hypothetical protein